METQSIVSLSDVTKTYRQGRVQITALDGVSLEVPQGDFLALAGPSGSGKTTLLNLIGGLDRADSGSIRLNGNDLGAMSESELAGMRLEQVGFVFQSYNLIPVLSAEENVEYVMLLQGVAARERREKARAILDDVGLEGMYDRRPAELSGGQQQRVAVARAVVSGPSIVLADEPTANLDSATGRALMDMMRSMNEAKGVTFVFSTHDRMVMDYAGRLIRIRDGRVAGDERREGEAES
ncbi:MAG: ABC transporter ATP-binding protein [Deltaproteobacteria bacterium]|nr:ABC transporter ATP-binding protein [Deltaproteobacteria bacterium]